MQVTVEQPPASPRARSAHWRAAAHAAKLRSRTIDRRPATVRDLDDLFPALARSSFRARFRLGAADAAYLAKKGLPVVVGHARDFIARRLAPAEPPNDGKQTPWRGHPVFVAQHATATCCRGCLAKWHGIAAGHALTAAEQDHVVAAIERWLRMQEESM